MNRPFSLAAAVAALALFSALLAGCLPTPPDLTARWEKITFAGQTAQLQLDLPEQRSAAAQNLPVPAAAKPFARAVTRYAVAPLIGLQLQAIAVTFDSDAIARRLGPPGSPGRQPFYSRFNETILQTFTAQFPAADGARDMTTNREQLTVNGCEVTVLTASYTSRFNAPGAFKAVLVPDESETWLLILLYSPGDKRAAAQAERILASLRLERHMR